MSHSFLVTIHTFIFLLYQKKHAHMEIQYRKWLCDTVVSSFTHPHVFRNLYSFVTQKEKRHVINNRNFIFGCTNPLKLLYDFRIESMRLLGHFYDTSCAFLNPFWSLTALGHHSLSLYEKEQLRHLFGERKSHRFVMTYRLLNYKTITLKLNN